MKLRYFIALMVIASGCTIAKTDGNGVVTNLNTSDAQIATTTAQVPVAAPVEPPRQEPVVTPPVDNGSNPPVNAPTNTTPTAPTLKQSVNLPVAFASQAPFGVWDELHGEACEEASMIMAVKYFNDDALTAHIMEQELLSLVKWETAQGYKVDVTVSEAVEILRDHLGLSATVVTDVSTDRIKKELSAGKLVIVPAAGRELGNPYFTSPGPIYHMLVIRGYDGGTGEFITNDPGTKRGEGYRYRYQVLLSAVHDWDHTRAEGGMTDEEMAQGRKAMIVVSK